MYARPGRRRPSPARLSGGIVWRLLVRHYRELIAYGAGWTDPEREQRVGDTGRHQPSGIDAIIDAELQRALADPDPQRGIAQLTARLAAAFVPDPAGVTRTMALGSERMGASSATRCPAAIARCAAPCGSSCGRSSQPRSSPSTGHTDNSHAGAPSGTGRTLR
jgi:hypothetical protein